MAQKKRKKKTALEKTNKQKKRKDVHTMVLEAEGAIALKPKNRKARN